MTKRAWQLVPGDMLYAQATKRFALILAIVSKQSDFIEVLTLITQSDMSSLVGGIKRMGLNKESVLDNVLVSSA